MQYPVNDKVLVAFINEKFGLGPDEDPCETCDMRSDGSCPFLCDSDNVN